MNLQIRSKDITLTDNTKAHIEVAIEAFSKYSLDITTINILNLLLSTKVMMLWMLLLI